MKDGYPEAIAPYSDWNEIVKIDGGATFNNAIWLPSIIQKVNREYAWGKSLGTLQSDGIMNEVILPLPSASKYQAEIDKIRSEAYVDIVLEKNQSITSTYLSQTGERQAEVFLKKKQLQNSR